MAVDLKGIWNENQKLFLSVIGVLVVISLMGMSGGPGSPFMQSTANVLFGVNETPSVGVDNGLGIDTGSGNLVATPVNNGKNALYRNAPLTQIRSGVNYKMLVKTNLGDFEVDLYESSAPQNVNNIVFLSKAGFYDGTSFHRVVKDYLIQGGDPLGTGDGSPGYFLTDEIDQNRKFQKYSVAMASFGPNKNGSQFFIVTADSASVLQELDGEYTIVGLVTSGFSTVDIIEGSNVETLSTSPYQYMPLNQIIINQIQIIEN